MTLFLSYLRKNFFFLSICVLWLFPVTFLGYWTAPVGTEIFQYLRYPAVALALLVLMFRGFNAIDWRLLIFLLVAFFASLLSDDNIYSLVKMIGLATIICVFSPLIRSNTARIMREGLWRNLSWSAVLITLLSIIWRIGGFQGPILYTKQGYPGITAHAMLFGPLAGIATLFLLSKSLSQKKYWLLVVVIICFFAAFASASRTAIAATFTGCLTVLTMALRKGKLQTWLRILSPVVIVLALYMIVNPEAKTTSGFLNVEDLQQKGLGNTRERVWGMRLQEFKENPVMGLGIGMSNAYEETLASGAVKGFTAAVEPGSAYLVVLSMTGAVGATSLLLVIGAGLNSLRKKWGKIPLERKYQITGIGLLLFVHGVAEGWIYSAGAVLCLFFWLWLGIVRDSSDAVLLQENRLQNWTVKL